MADLMRETTAASRSEAVREAVRTYLQGKRRERFKRLAGSRISDADWAALEEAEIREAT